MTTPTITSLTTTGQPGGTFQIDGSGFGASQLSSAVLLYPNSEYGFDQTTMTSWNDLHIEGTLPHDLTLGVTAFLLVLLEGDTVAAHSDFFVIGEPVAGSSNTQLAVGTVVGTDSPQALTESDASLPTILHMSPIGYVNSFSEGSYSVQYAASVSNNVVTYTTVTMAGTHVIAHSTLVAQQQRSVLSPPYLSPATLPHE